MASKRIFSFPKFLAAFSASSFVMLLGFLPPFDIIERTILDKQFQIRGPEAPHPDIAIIAIDDLSLKQVGMWPWPRSHHMDLLHILTDQEPAVVFFDMIFSEKSTDEEDKVFAQAIKENRHVALPLICDNIKTCSEDHSVFPIQVFRENARRLGFANIAPDIDGHIREICPKAGNYYHASLVSAALKAGYNEAKLKAIGETKSFLINFPGPYEVFNQISFYQLVTDFDSQKTQSFLKSLKEKIVLIGHIATGTAMDLKPTVFSPQYPGVGLLASAVHTFLTGRFIRQLPKGFYFLALFLFACLVLILSSLSTPLKNLFYVAASLAVIFEISQISFQYFLLWIPFFGFLVLGATLYLVATLIEFVQVRIEREVFARELTLASRIQKNLLPADIPKVTGLEIATISLPARHVGGDFYDFIPLQDEKLGICVGDVSGKGIPAALFMAKAISEFRREADSSAPSSVVHRLNAKIAGGGFQGLFFTMLYMVVDPAKREIIFANGGHEPLFMYRKRTGSVETFSTKKGTPLGITPDAEYDDLELKAEAGDVILLQSDGVKEAMNSRHDIFGMKRIELALLEFASLDTKSFLDHFLKRINEFVKNAPQHDDLTLVCVKFS